MVGRFSWKSCCTCKRFWQTRRSVTYTSAGSHRNLSDNLLCSAHFGELLHWLYASFAKPRQLYFSCCPTVQCRYDNGVCQESPKFACNTCNCAQRVNQHLHNGMLPTCSFSSASQIQAKLLCVVITAESLGESSNALLINCSAHAHQAQHAYNIKCGISIFDFLL